MTHECPLHWRVLEPPLLFHPSRSSDRHEHPLRGLLEYGPFSRSLVNCVMDPIRVATIAPEGESDKLHGLVSELEHRHFAKERKQYLPEFPGFSRVFGAKVVLAESVARVQVPSRVELQLASSAQPHLILADHLARALTALQSMRSEYDVVLIYLPDRWKAHFEFRSATEDFDLHDHLKAISAVKGIPTQMVRQDSGLAYPCRCSVMWRLGLALYCKAGGVPWKIADASPDTAFVGLSYAIRNTGQPGSRFVTCCSQVFDADGAGLEFILYETDDIRIEHDNPYLSRSEMRRVMARSLALYQRQHTGQTPKHVVVHKTSDFRPEEIDGCFDAWSSTEGLELLQIQQNVPWRGVKIDPPSDRREKKGKPSRYPCERGSCLQLGSREVLVWTQGNAPSVVDRGNYFKEGKGIPSPILVTRFAGHSSWEEQCRYILALTKMNWNNDALYDRLPVTLGYASALARTVKRMSELARRPYQFRFFM